MDRARGGDLLASLREVPGPRRPSNGTQHDFPEILVIAVCAVLSDCDTVEDIAEWAVIKAPWLRCFLVLENGMPPQDKFLRIFRLIDPQQFEAAFRRRVGGIVTARGGDYLVAVKGNQPTLLRSIEDAFADRAGARPRHENVGRRHGRTVGQFAWTAPAADVIDPGQWPGCRSIGRILTQRVKGGQYGELEFRYYLSSRELSAEDLASTARAHWGNRLHRMLDVQFGEDACAVRKDHAPQDLSLLKKMVLNLIRADTSDPAKASLRRKRAAWDDDIRMAMLGVRPL